MTPGPWNVMPSKRSSLLHIETDLTCHAGAGIPICSVPGNHMANALLIAAAPDLLIACGNARAFMGDKPPDETDTPYHNGVRALIEQLDNAIAKAKGQS